MRSIVVLSICIAAIGCGKPPKARPAPEASSTPAPRPRSPLDDVAAAAREAKAHTPCEPAVEAASVWQVVSVHDGDTLHVLDDAKHEHTIRLDGIDAPERKQACGTNASERLHGDRAWLTVAVQPPVQIAEAERLAEACPRGVAGTFGL
jgi:endonuclease YncB( thermonuclease family)